MRDTIRLGGAYLWIALFALAGCATVPGPQATTLTTATPEAMVATIRAAAGNDPAELSVQPLRDPMVEDLRQRAVRLQAQQQYAEAAAALDQALAIVPDDPALLQERAEAAILLQAMAQAEQLARRADALGAKVGPLCRRHWATVQQARLVAGDAGGAAAAKAKIAACKVAGPNRY